MKELGDVLQELLIIFAVICAIAFGVLPAIYLWPDVSRFRLVVATIGAVGLLIAILRGWRVHVVEARKGREFFLRCVIIALVSRIALASINN